MELKVRHSIGSEVKTYRQFGIGALIVYDITDVDSFAKVDIWVNELKKYL